MKPRQVIPIDFASAMLAGMIGAASLLFGANTVVRAQDAAQNPRAPAQGTEHWSLDSGMEVLALAPGSAGGIGLRLRMEAVPSVPFIQPAPISLEVVDSHGAAQWLMEGYQQVSPDAGALRCTAVLQSPNGSRFSIVDVYAAGHPGGELTLSRRVTVESASPADAGFSSAFTLAPQQPTAMTDCDFFAPGIWYGQNNHVPPTALASGLADRYYYFREDRLPLPLIMMRDRRSGTTLTLAHLDGNPTTFAGEDGLRRIIDARMQFGSIGIRNLQGPSPTFLFPGTEGERTYIYGGSVTADRWALRSHPVQVGIPHAYRLLLRLDHTPDFPTAVRESWRAVYDRQRPPVIPVDLGAVYRQGTDLLATYCREYNGVISMPFAVNVPDGGVKDTSSQMGFVGQALPAAALLLRRAVEDHDAAAQAHAVELVDFWVHNSLSPAGVPRTWYDIKADGTVIWRNYPTYLRVASDGIDGALQAWNVMRGIAKPEWLAFCRHYGDWLAAVQNPDGSFYRSYGFDGQPIDHSTDTTDHPISFLVDLYRATGDARYRTVAEHAGMFCLHSVHEAYAYVGGTPDNPNVTDKEAGMIALEAFLALWDATGDRRWLTAAGQAADFSETWIYCWNIPVPEDDPKRVFPKGRTTFGLSLIATGHSGCDTFMAAAPFLYYRLYLLTGDAHYRDVARMLLYDTKQLLDWDGTLGYAHRGLQTEALTLAPLRGHGVSVWLPWLTVAQLTPLVRLQDVFGSMDIDGIQRQSISELRRRDRAFSATRGFMKVAN